MVGCGFMLEPSILDWGPDVQPSAEQTRIGAEVMQVFLRGRPAMARTQGRGRRRRGGALPRYRARRSARGARLGSWGPSGGTARRRVPPALAASGAVPGAPALDRGPTPGPKWQTGRSAPYRRPKRREVDGRPSDLDPNNRRGPQAPSPGRPLTVLRVSAPPRAALWRAL